MKVKQILILFLAAPWLFSACTEKEACCDNPQADYSKGIFVVNEGPFGGTGTISWHNPETGETQDSLFEKANNGAVLGQFVQSLTFYGNKAYIVVNGANRVVVVDAKTFSFVGTIGGLEQPRFFLPLDNNTAYISQWGNDGLTGSVAKVDLNTLEVLTTIPTGHGPEKMVRMGDKVYVANSGGYGKDSTLTEILISSDSPQILALPAGINPATLVFSNQKLYYLCKGFYLDADPKGYLDYVNGGLGIATPASSDDLLVDENTGEMYFLGGKTIYKANAGAQGTELSAWLPPNFSDLETPYGLAFDKEQKLLYCADAKDYSSAGKVYVFKTDGTQMGAFRTGLLPGEIIIVK